jgi:cytochrome o ubiquinol oxidase subunit 1
MPLYVLGFMGMPRRMQHYSNPEWQPLLIVAAAGALLILFGISCLIIQLVVSIRNREENRDLTGDPWDARTLEWSTSSPPPAYNFAALPLVDEKDAFMVMKEKHTAYNRPDQYTNLHLPKNTGAGFVIGGTAFLFGFAMVWHIWWLAIMSMLAMILVVIIRSFNDDNEGCIPLAEIEGIENNRFRQLMEAQQQIADNGNAGVNP